MPPTSSSLADERACLLPPPQHGAARPPTLAERSRRTLADSRATLVARFGHAFPSTAGAGLPKLADSLATLVAPERWGGGGPVAEQSVGFVRLLSVIDLRSDTVTKPTRQMREAMLAAAVGDDVYAEDPTVHELEQRIARLLGHEAGLFCVSGSMCNVLGIRLLVEPGEEVLCDVQAHIARAEMGAHAAVQGVTMRTFPSTRGRLQVEEVTKIIAPSAGPYLVSTAAVAVENTHNFGGGTVQPFDELTAVGELCREHGVGYHLDGARLWNAHIATGVALEAYGQLFDTVSVCFSKGLGAPVGSVLVSTAENIARARVMRKRLGGGWRQAGVLAAACLYALDHHLQRLADDHAAARIFAETVAAYVPAAVEPDAVETNVVVIDTGAIPAAPIAAAAAERGVQVSALGPYMIRAVTHLDVTAEDCEWAGQLVGKLLTA